MLMSLPMFSILISISAVRSAFYSIPIRIETHHTLRDITGSKDRNRALEGDIVAVELLDVSNSSLIASIELY